MTRTTPLSGTVVTIYTYDAANRLADRVSSDGRSYTYDGSARGQLLTEWTQGYPVRTFTYDSAGQLVEATVFTQTTTFTYNGLGERLAVTVEGQGTTTYTLDHAGGGQILVETAPTSTVTYFYGEECLGEFRDGAPLYYLHDGDRYVRQGTDAAGVLASAWLFDPDGTVLEGPEGPVSHLVCGGVYDWSTGLLYKDGRYFDPALGIWLALVPLVILAIGKKQSKYQVPYVFFLLLSFTVTNITACKNEEQFREELAQHCIDIYPTPGPVNPNTCTALPTSDAEPVYNPSEWGDCWTSQYCNNCYSYALDQKSSCDWQEIEADRQDHLHPGEITGHPYFSGVTSREELFKATTCENIVSAIVKHDGYFVADCEGKCRPGHYKVALFIDPYEENIPGDTADYHFYRQDAGGCWSHKPGKFFATNLDASGSIIADPRLSNTDYSPDGPNYKEFCDCFCIPREG